MEEMLQEMGLARAFGPGADFTGICDGGLCIDKVIHKARIELNEEGTRAAAATVVTMKATAVAPPEEEITVRADHPFVYAIMYQGIPVFLGTYE
jgi:serpin B